MYASRGSEDKPGASDARRRLRALGCSSGPWVAYLYCHSDVRLLPCSTAAGPGLVTCSAWAWLGADGGAGGCTPQEERARLEQEETARALANAEAVHRQRLHKAAHLPPEPPAGAEVRLLEGWAHARVLVAASR